MRCRGQGLVLFVTILLVPLPIIVSSFSLFRFATGLKHHGGEQQQSTIHKRSSGSVGEKSKPTDEKSTTTTTTTKKPFVLSPKWSRILYCISSLNPLIAVLMNDYTKMIEVPFVTKKHTNQHKDQNIITQTVGGLFLFARLKPRVSFAIGAMLRALQCCTAFQYVIDPSVGVGFGLNALCWFAKSRWPPTIFLGWSLTRPVWKWLGGEPPISGPVPITYVSRKQQQQQQQQQSSK